MFRLVAISLLLTAAAPAVAQSAATSAQPPAPQAQAKADPLNKIVCRYEETVGSRLKRHKVCATLREWKDQEDDSRRAVERLQEGSGVVPST